MRAKRFLVVALVMVLAAALLTGCSTAEVGFYNLQKEISTIKLYEDTGEISIDLKELPVKPSSTEEWVQLAIVQKALSDFSISYRGRADVASGLLDYTFYLKDRKTGAERKLLAVLYKEDAVYVEVQEAVKFIKSFGNEELNRELEQALAGVDYIKIDLRELYESLGVLGQGSAKMPFATGIYPFTLSHAQKQQQVWQRLFTGLMTEVYNDFETGLVEKDGNGYVLTVEAEAVAGLLQPFVAYTLEHIEELGAYLKEFVNALSPEELAVLGFEPAMREQFNFFIDAAVADLTLNRQVYLEKIAAGLDGEATHEFLQMFAGSKLVSRLEKQKDDTYQSLVTVDLKVRDPEELGTLDLTITGRSTFKPGAPFSVTVPTDGILNLSELESRIQEQTMQVMVEANRFTLRKGQQTTDGAITVKMLDGSTYLPMRQVAEAFGEQVGWNQAENQAYVERDGKRITVTGRVIDGRTFIKIRDFEKLGYQVQWDGATKTVLITK